MNENMDGKPSKKADAKMTETKYRVIKSQDLYYIARMEPNSLEGFVVAGPISDRDDAFNRAHRLNLETSMGYYWNEILSRGWRPCDLQATEWVREVPSKWCIATIKKEEEAGSSRWEWEVKLFGDSDDIENPTESTCGDAATLITAIEDVDEIIEDT